MDLGENHQPTGYEFDFVDPLSSEKECSICRNALRTPVQLISCGHRYCKTCLNSWIESDHRGPKLKCPQDRKPIPAEGGWFHDQACEREILSLRVKCKKNKQGCDWIGELCHYFQSKHIDVCPFEDVTCENCDIHMERRFLNTHTASKCYCRIVECEYCEEKFEFWEKESHQDKACLCFPLNCPQRCGLLVPRKEMEFHVRDACMMTTVFCPFKEAGCTFHDKRSNLTTHLEVSREEHLKDVWSKYVKTTEQLKQCKTEITSLKKKVEEQDDEVGALQIENALLNNRFSNLEEGTEKTKERVNELEKVQGQLEELQKESTKTQIMELKVMKNQVAELQTWKNSAPWQRALERRCEHETNLLKERVVRLQRQNDETFTFMREEMKQFVDKVVCRFKATLEKQQLNPATRPVNSTNQLSMRRTSETPTDDRNRLPVNNTQAAFGPDNLVRARKRQKVEWEKMAKILESKMNNGQPRRTNSEPMSLLTDRRHEIADSDEDDFYL